MKMDTIRACSIWRALEVVGDVPVLLIMEQAFLGVHGFEKFVEQTGFARSVVSNRLKKLVAEDCLAMAPQPGSRRTSYRITEKGRALFPVAMAMVRWQHRWEPERRDFQIRLEHATCGHAIEPKPVCLSCTAVIDPREVDWEEGPGLVQVTPDYSRRRRPSVSVTNRRGGTLVDSIIGIFGDRWSTLVIRAMFSGLYRFDQIQQDTLMAPNILSGRIDELIEAGVLRTEKYCEHPPRYEYRLTEKGRELYPVILGLLQWGDRYYADEKGPPLLLYHRPCGDPLEMRMHCNHCGDELLPSDMRFGLIAPE